MDWISLFCLDSLEAADELIFEGQQKQFQ